MSVCPGCGRCRECGAPAPSLSPYKWWGQWPAPYQPIWVSPMPNTAYPYVGDPVPGQWGTITVTC